MNLEEYAKLQKIIEMSSAQGGYFVSINGMNFDTDCVRLEADNKGEIYALMFNSDHELIEIANINHWNIDTVQVRNYAIDNGDNGLVYQYNLEAVLDVRDQKSLEHWKGVLAGC